MPRLTKILLPVVIVLFAGLVAFAIFEFRPTPDTRRPEILPPVVRVETAAAERIRLTVRSQGTVTPRTESQVVPEVSGRVTRVSDAFVAGGFFEKGDVLLEVDPYDYHQAVVRARAEVAQARLRLANEEAEADVARREWEDLGRGDGSPLALRVPQVENARAALGAADAAVERAQRDLERTTVRAPYAGRLRTKQVDVGQFVVRGAPVATIYAVDWAEVRLPLPSRELAFVDVPLDYRGERPGSAGPEVVLSAEFGGRTYTWNGRIVRTEGERDPRTRMVQVVARVPDPYGRGPDSDRPPLAVGMFVEAEIQGTVAEGVTALPREALRTDGRVWVVDPDDRLRFRDVTVLRAERDRVLIADGLAAGDRVCVSPLETATDGMLVRVAGAAAQQDEEDPA